MRLAEYARFDGLGLARLVKKGEVQPAELCAVAMEAISTVNPQINAVVSTVPEAAEKQRRAGVSGPFAGVPFLLKEYPPHAADIQVRLGSRLTKEGVFARSDSSLMTRFRRAGLVTIGTAATPEFAVDGTTESWLYGPTRNPWDLLRTPGGSSGGSAAAVSAGIVPMAHGNDSGGSIRFPAACCGLVGLKPTRGRVPSGPHAGEPLFGLATEFALTKTLRDAAALLDAVAGPDIGSYAWAERPGNPYIDDMSMPVKPLRIAFTAHPSNGAPVDEDIIKVLRGTVRDLERLGHHVVEDSPEIDEERHFLMKIRFWTTVMRKEINDLARALGKWPSEENLEPVVYSAYDYGRRVSVNDLLEAIEIQNAISRKAGRFFSKYDVLITPAAAQLPLKLGELTTGEKLDVRTWFRRSNRITGFQGLVNTTGQPALSLPLGWSRDGLPIGIQLTGRFADETTLFRLARQLEQCRPWKNKYPPTHVLTGSAPGKSNSSG